MKGNNLPATVGERHILRFRPIRNRSTVKTGSSRSDRRRLSTPNRKYLSTAETPRREARALEKHVERDPTKCIACEDGTESSGTLTAGRFICT